MKINKLAVCILSVFILFNSALAAEQTSLMIHEAWVNLPPPGTDVTAGYCMIHNTGSTDVKLVKVSSPDFGRVEMHRSTVINGMASMAQQDSITIPANGAVTFKPGDYHLMLFQPRQPLTAGGKVTLSFQFADSSHIEATATIRQEAGSGHEDHSQHQHH